ncbi:hypothetical protein A5676_07645 [Mycobacterium malmoense]|uniref:hypothetical protein n=1 Tax=Mycobacterium malmoense TaxID=1780 RepID=UPI00080B004D|nr:hypothetical protein [Mycobacterium malmoense]OCB31458.1 hypothetical protein A5676_07645 [Mycobacterium malmoense]
MGHEMVGEIAEFAAGLADGIGFLNNGGTLLEVGNKSVRGVMFYEPVLLAIALNSLQRNTHTQSPGRTPGRISTPLTGPDRFSGMNRPAMAGQQVCDR